VAERELAGSAGAEDLRESDIDTRSPAVLAAVWDDVLPYARRPQLDLRARGQGGEQGQVAAQPLGVKVASEPSPLDDRRGSDPGLAQRNLGAAVGR
jgi:hypothetical protein